MTDWSNIQAYCAEMQDKMLGQLIGNIMRRGDMDKNDEENKACEIFRMICKKALQTDDKVFDAEFSGCEDSIQIHSRLSKAGKRQTLREAHILLTETNELFDNLDNRLAKELVETYLTDLRQRMKQLLEISSEKM